MYSSPNTPQHKIYTTLITLFMCLCLFCPSLIADAIQDEAPPINLPPVMTQTPTTTPDPIHTDEMFLFLYKVEDPEKQPLIHTWTKISGPGELNTHPSRFFTTYSLDQAGTYTLRLTVSDNVHEIHHDMQVEVLPINLPPVMTQTPTTTPDPIHTDEMFLFLYKVEDPEKQPLTHTWTKISGPGELNTHSSRFFTTYSLDQAGSYTLRLTVSDNEHEIHHDMQVEVLPINLPPEITKTPYTVPEVIHVDELFLIGYSVIDPEEQPLSHTWTKINGPGELIVHSSKFLTGYSLNQVGNYTLRLTVSDGVHETQADFEVNVLTNIPVNQLPTADDQIIQLNQGQSKDIILTANDEDAEDVISYIIVNQPSHGTLTGSAPNLNYTPNSDYAGRDTFTFKASDSKDESQTATVSLYIEAVTEGDGAFKVGHVKHTFQNTFRSRDLNIDVWYPVDPSDYDFTAPKTSYIVPDHVSNNFLGASHLRGKGPLSSKAVTDATLRANTNFPNGYPIVIYSHGGTGYGTQSFQLMESLASHGYIVVSPDHLSDFDGMNRVDNLNDRVDDIRLIIDELTSFNTISGGKFEGLLDLNTIGLCGESFGGITSFVAGAGWRHIAAETRIKAIIPMAPPIQKSSAHGFGIDESEIAQASIPKMFVGGLKDIVVREPFNARYGFENSTTDAISYLVEIKEGRHASFSSVHKFGQWAIDNGLARVDWPFILEWAYNDAVDQSLILPTEFLGIQRKVVTSFFNVHLQNDSTFEVNINPNAPGYVNDPEVNLEIKFNQAPVADNQVVQLNQNQAQTILLVASDANVSDGLTFSIVDQPSHGTLTGSADNLIYTPNTDYIGKDTFTFKATDGKAESNTATVDLYIEPVTVWDGSFKIGHLKHTFPNAEIAGDLTIDIWYPVNQNDYDVTAPKTSYIIPEHIVGTFLGNSHLRGQGPPSTKAVYDAKIRAHADFPTGYPIVIYSHGSHGYGTQSFELMESIASHGYIVVSADHPLSSGLESRLIQVSDIIDELTLRHNTSGDKFHDLLNLNQIGMCGESAGGMVTFAAAAGLNNTPAESRIKAIIPMAPPISQFTPTAISQVSIPKMFISGLKDLNVPEPANARYGFELSSTAANSYLLEIKEGRHAAFSSVKAIGDWAIANGLSRSAWPTIMDWAYKDGVDWSNIATEDFMRLQRKYVTSFFNVYLQNKSAFEANINPNLQGYVADPEVNYEYKAKVVAPPNAAPVAQGQSLELQQNTSIDVQLGATDANPQDTLVYTVVTHPSHGTLSGTAPNLNYTPNPGYAGSDEFQFKVNDGTDDSNIAIVSITIRAIEPKPTTRLTGSDGPSDQWNVDYNWSHGIPSGLQDAIIASGITSKVNQASTPVYTGSLTLEENASLRLDSDFSESSNAVQSAQRIVMQNNSSIVINMYTDLKLPPITLEGSASLETIFRRSDWETTELSTIDGPHTITLKAFNGHRFKLTQSNTFHKFIANAHDRYYIHAQATAALGLGNVTINGRADGRSAQLILEAEDTIADHATLTLNGKGFDNNNEDRITIATGINEVVGQLVVDGVLMPEGTYTNSEDWLSGAGSLIVSSSSAVVPVGFKIVENDQPMTKNISEATGSQILANMSETYSGTVLTDQLVSFTHSVQGGETKQYTSGSGQTGVYVITSDIQSSDQVLELPDPSFSLKGTSLDGVMVLSALPLNKDKNTPDGAVGKLMSFDSAVQGGVFSIPHDQVGGTGNYKLYRQGEDGVFVDTGKEVLVDGDFVSFTLDSFSVYVLVADDSVQSVNELSSLSAATEGGGSGGGGCLLKRRR